MKTMKTTLYILAGITLSTPVLADPPGVSLIQDTPEALFAPPGFDSNDHSQVVLSGSFINTCHKVGLSKAEVDVQSKVIHITQQAYLIDSSWCLHVLVPYTSVVDVGILPPGEYSVKIRQDASKEKDFGRMTIAAAQDQNTIGPDEKLYAIVDEVSFENGQITVKGKLPGLCTRLKEVSVLTRKANIVEVLPLAETVTQGGALNCSPGLTPFESKVPFQSPWKGPTLFHVRSLNGQSINKVIDLN